MGEYRGVEDGENGRERKVEEFENGERGGGGNQGSSARDEGERDGSRGMTEEDRVKTEQAKAKSPEPTGGGVFKVQDCRHREVSADGTKCLGDGERRAATQRLGGFERLKEGRGTPRRAPAPGQTGHPEGARCLGRCW